MQRLHEDDMTGFILAGKTGEEWKQLKLPALQPDGTALWPHKHTAQELLGMKAAAPRMFAGQMQQEPAPDEGDYFKRGWFREYSNIPPRLKKYGASDFAVSDGEGDWTVHGVFGVDEHDDLYILDWWRERASPDVWIERMLDLAKSHQTIAWAVEKGVIERSIGPLLNKRMSERKEYPYFVKYASASNKEERAQSIRGRMAARGIYVPAGKAWVGDLITECLRFPTVTHDDQVDTLGIFGRMLAGLRSAEPESKPKPPRTTMTVNELLGIDQDEVQ
jgi:predicted phage terminase large subunit-like protein